MINGTNYQLRLKLQEETLCYILCNTIQVFTSFEVGIVQGRRENRSVSVHHIVHLTYCHWINDHIKICDHQN